MSVHDILRAIDWHIARLVEARDLLAQSSSPGRSLPKALKIKPSKARRRSARQAAKPSAVNNVSPQPVTLTETVSFPPEHSLAEVEKRSASLSGSGKAPSPDSEMRQTVAAVPARAIRSGRTRIDRRKMTPPTALGHSVPSGVVVVSAEEAKRVRERANEGVGHQFHPPQTEPAGRRAFDALFGNLPEQPADSTDRTASLD